MMQIRKVYVLAFGIICAGLADAATVSYSTTTNWSSKTVNDIDTVVVNGTNGTVVTLDQSDTAATVRVNNQVSPITTKLKIDQNHTLNATTQIQLGTQTGGGIIAQSAGTVTTPIIQIKLSDIGGELSRYDLSGGSVSASTRVDINDKGLLSVSGGSISTPALNVYSGGSASLTGGTLNLDGTLTSHGTVTLDGGSILSTYSGANRTFAGTGKVEVKSGILTMDGALATDKININTTLFEVSGGAVTLDGQVLVGDGGAAEFKVIGDAASINFTTLNQSAAAGESGTFRFIFDETGVSTINVASWMNMGAASIIVDGSAYTNGAGTFVLFNSVNLASLADTNNFTITGFSQNAYITQDEINDNIILTVIPEPTTLGLFIVASGGMMLLRRLHR